MPTRLPGMTEEVFFLVPLLGADVVENKPEVIRVLSGSDVGAQLPVTNPAVLEWFAFNPGAVPFLLKRSVQLALRCQGVFLPLSVFIEEHIRD